MFQILVKLQIGAHKLQQGKINADSNGSSAILSMCENKIKMS